MLGGRSKPVRSPNPSALSLVHMLYNMLYTFASSRYASIPRLQPFCTLALTLVQHACTLRMTPHCLP